MIDLSSIRGRHQGQPCAVLGGGPTLLRDLKQIPLDAILIGVNQHAMLMNLDYVHFLDREIWPVVRESDALKCSHHRELAIDIYTGVIPEFGLSGASAVWMADFLGCSPIWVAGCDNYTETRRYWHSSPNTKNPELGCSATSIWEQLRKVMQHPEFVIPCSGPLQRIFPHAS